MLVHAPAPVVPLVALVCVGLPMFGAWDLRCAVRVLRGARPSPEARAAIASLRRSLQNLPEVEHPLGH